MTFGNGLSGTVAAYISTGCWKTTQPTTQTGTRRTPSALSGLPPAAVIS